MIFNRLLNTYEYVFFKIYTWNKYLWKNEEAAAFNSTGAITYSFMACLFSLIFFVNKFLDISIRSPFKNLYVSIGITLIVFLIHYFLFEHKKKYLQIEAKFLAKKESRFISFLKTFFVFIYAIGSIVVCIFFI